jgi:hypothetical protein
MKKSELQQIIKEEIQNILHEEDPTQTSFNKKLGLPEPSGVKNTMRPKEYMEGWKAYKENQGPTNPYSEPDSFEERSGREDSFADRSKKQLLWTLGYNDAKSKFDKKTPSPQPNLKDYYDEKGSGGYTGD